MEYSETSQIDSENRSVFFDSELIERYDSRGPRYTSYPTALQFNENFTEETYRAQATLSNRESRPLSIYVHIPFCRSLCYYCACNKVVTRNQGRIQNYLRHLDREIVMQGALFDNNRTVEQLHFGGGTPTYLSDRQLCDLMARLCSEFDLENGSHREFSIEVDPRSVSGDSISLLADVGFNRLSLGVQDFDPAVQKAVNRVQTEDEITAIVDAARHCGFKSISFDLIYGLPRQSVASFDRTLDRVLAMRPDRLAIYNYAHLPGRFKGQRLIDEADIPDRPDKLKILNQTIGRLIDADYRYIGMDHFALPDDDLAVAKQNRTLQRNFQGYSTHGASDLVGLGASAISNIGNTIAQNATTKLAYEALVGSDHLATQKGIEVDDDDQLRGSVIQELMCHDGLDFGQFENTHSIGFEDYFATELLRLRPLEEDGLVVLTPDGIRITPKGRLLLRSIAMVFDRHLSADSDQERFSRTIEYMSNFQSLRKVLQRS